MSGWRPSEDLPASAEGAARRHLERCLERIGASDRRLAALVHRDEPAARLRADALDQLPTGQRGPLHGAVVVVKDNIDVAGQVTGCCSPARGTQSAEIDAPVVARLREAGAIILGRANMDELAMGASTATSAYGPSRNPHDTTRSPGGSSGGCAVALAAGFADLAVGTDTGGSIREPASQCGVWGLAPTPALVPTDGVVPFAPSADRVGPMSGDPALLRTALTVMAGLTSAPGVADGAERHRLLRVGLVRELATDRNQPGVRDVLDDGVARLHDAGAQVEEVSIADAPGALAAYMAITSVESLPHLRPWLATGRTGAEVTRRTAHARRMLASDLDHLVAAEDLRQRLRQQVTQALEAYDVLLSPTLPTTAPAFAPAGPPTAQVADPLTAPYTDCWTVVANLAGVPALSAPAGVSSDDGMPVGLMLMGRPGADLDLIAVGERLLGA